MARTYTSTPEPRYVSKAKEAENANDVYANPTLSGNEPYLTGLEVDDTKYQISTTYRKFPTSWSTTGTTAAFCAQVNADSSAVQGNAYLGEVTWSDLPESMVNAEVVVEIMAGTGTTNKVIHLTLTSGNTASYRWEYTYWNNGSNISGWIGFQPELLGGSNGQFLTWNNGPVWTTVPNAEDEGV